MVASAGVLFTQRGAPKSAGTGIPLASPYQVPEPRQKSSRLVRHSDPAPWSDPSCLYSGSGLEGYLVFGAAVQH